MKKHEIEHVQQKIEQIEILLINIDKTLAINTQHLAEHMRRTELLEQQIEPIKQHVEQVQGAGKLLGILALIATIVSVVLMLD